MATYEPSDDPRAFLEALTQEELDDAVHDAKSEEATKINNSGRDAQIAYLVTYLA